MFNTLKKQIRNPYIFSLLSKFVMVFTAFLFTVIQARYLGSELKGQIAVVSSITGITSIVFEFGIHQAFPYYKKKTEGDIVPIFMRISLLLLLVSVAISCGAIFWLSLEPKYIAVMIINPLLVYTRIVSYITLVEMPNKKNAIEMLIGFIELLIVIGLWLFFPASFAIGVFVIAFKDLIMAIIFTYFWRKKLFHVDASLKEWIVKIVKFGFFPMLSLLMTTLNYRLDVIMLEGKVTDAAIGVYSVGVALAERVWMIPDALKGVLVSNIAKGKDAKEVAYVIRICNTACLFLILLLVLLGEPFIRLMYGEEYNGAYQVTLILLIGALFMVYYKMIAAYNIVLGKQRVSFVFLLISVISNIIFNYLLIPVMGIYGAGIASIISYSLCSIMFIVYYIRTTHISFKDMLLVTPSDVRMLKAKFGKKHADLDD